MKELTVLATLENIRIITDFINEQLKELNCPQKICVQIDVAIDELFGNIARYAYVPDKGPATVRVDVLEDPMRVEITFIDQGKPFDPLTTKEPDTTLSAKMRRIGGLGLFMVKRTMDGISYKYKDGKNILTIQKKVRPDSSKEG